MGWIYELVSPMYFLCDLCEEIANNNIGSKSLLGEGDLTGRELLIGRWSRLGEGEKLYVDFDRARLWGTVRLCGRGEVAAFCMVAFSSRKIALVAQKEANCCW